MPEDETERERRDRACLCRSPPMSSRCNRPTGARNCASSRRCCSPPPSRSTRHASPGISSRARTCARCSRSCRGLYAGRGVNLVRVAGKWAFRTADDLSFLLEKQAVEQRRLSRAALETLAIIAYHQPVTRAEIEEIRGVSTSKGTIDVLLETGWIKLRGRRRAPGRPVTYGTTAELPQPFRLRLDPGPAGLERAEGRRAARFQPAARLHHAEPRRCAAICATTRSRSRTSSSATSRSARATRTRAATSPT